VGHVSRKAQTRNAGMIFVRVPEGRNRFLRPRIILKCILKVLNVRPRESADDEDTTVCCANRTDDFLGGVSNLYTFSCSLSSLTLCLLRVLSLSAMESCSKHFQVFVKLLPLLDLVH
jgi:hypothetical protein